MGVDQNNPDTSFCLAVKPDKALPLSVKRDDEKNRIKDKVLFFKT